MKTSPEGRKAIEQREGCRLRAYWDRLGGVWTIGYGHTSAAGQPAVYRGKMITQASADKILSQDLAKWEAIVNKGLQGHSATQNEFDAFVSLCHNIGGGGFLGSSALHFFRQGNILAAANAFLMWEHPPELKGRRESERAQFLGKDK